MTKHTYVVSDFLTEENSTQNNNGRMPKDVG